MSNKLRVGGGRTAVISHGLVRHLSVASVRRTAPVRVNDTAMDEGDDEVRRYIHRAYIDTIRDAFCLHCILTSIVG